jgi:N-acetylmuramoyl-L-alanine amidase
MPEIKWVGSPNYSPGRGGHKIAVIVNHIMCGTMDGTDSWFKNRASQVSAHYGIARDGTIHQYVRDEDTAWHAGIVKNPTWPLYSQYAGHINQVSIGIEHEGWPGEPLTEVQYQSTLWLHRYLHDKHGILLDRLHIIGHDQLDTVTRRDCPGPKFPWSRLFKDLGAQPLSGRSGGVIIPAGGGDDMTAKELPTLQQGVSGHKNAVIAVQAIVGATVDGIYGPNTAAKVKQWQAVHGLPATGKVDAQTWAKMLQS